VNCPAGFLLYDANGDGVIDGCIEGVPIP